MPLAITLGLRESLRILLATLLELSLSIYIYIYKVMLKLEPVREHLVLISETTDVTGPAGPSESTSG